MKATARMKGFVSRPAQILLNATAMVQVLLDAGAMRTSMTAIPILARMGASAKTKLTLLHAIAQEPALRDRDANLTLMTANPLHARMGASVLMESRASNATAMEQNMEERTASTTVPTARSFPQSARTVEGAAKKENVNARKQASKDLIAPWKQSPAK